MLLHLIARRTLTTTVAATLLVVGLLLAPRPPSARPVVRADTGALAPADAASSICARGYRLGRYSYAYPAYDLGGEHLWTIFWRTRWCYSPQRHVVASVYAPRPSAQVYGIFGFTWHFGGIVDKEARYTDVDPRGVRHPRFPRWGHSNWWVVEMDHCLVNTVMCTKQYFKVGTIAYWDGSKKIYVP